ncbi:UDP-N-acetylglucosamine transferase subunit ALG13 homolog [Musca domestica]|uniref:UDP-N-acetylglucosamine transferase subunit ALG13 n=1 Tax=Musca domestica TaxID=7370 RepID=A0A1I8MZF9_MUSDO|nr:UDP-N-acetylglucosamine transferase subunit ALG13 homolog [Musca domestica]
MTPPITTVYVTVGSTKFDSLIREMTSDDILQLLKKKGCKHLILQVGKGNKVDEAAIAAKHGIQVEQYDFKIEPKRMDIINSDLVVGHAGAGTCLDILTARKLGVLVINDQLMNNHQQELALHMKKEGYLQCCTVNELKTALESVLVDKQNTYEPGKNMDKFVEFMDNLLVN